MLASAHKVTLGLLILFAPTPAVAETVELRSGGALVGDVRLEGDDVVVDARYPDVKTIKLKREDVAPESLFRILERSANPKDASERRKLGELAESLGLKAVAVAEYRAAAQIDPGFAKEAEARTGRLREEIAADLLEDARQLLEEGRVRAALMYLHTILEVHAGTQAAKDAAALLPKAHEEAGKAADIARNTVPEDQAEATIAEVESHLSKARRARAEATGHGSSVRDQRALERALVHYEAAWADARRLPAAASNEELAKRIEEIRVRTKSYLVEAYLAAGAIQLQRRAIPAAEEYCNKACEIDPERASTHELHRLIIAAKALYSGWGRGAHR